MYIVSGCLLGHNCKYDGGNNENEEVKKFCSEHKHIVVCPERAGKLPCPRPPAEKVGSRIINIDGVDVTDAFLAGAKMSLDSCFAMAEMCGEKIEGAILKANSPSCGVGHIYDGTFSGTLKEGNGVFASMVLQRGIEVITEKEKIKW
jgi:uncharacterized protein YbbK (DUF523 family)